MDRRLKVPFEQHIRPSVRLMAASDIEHLPAWKNSYFPCGVSRPPPGKRLSIHVICLTSNNWCTEFVLSVGLQPSRVVLMRIVKHMKNCPLKLVRIPSFNEKSDFLGDKIL